MAVCAARIKVKRAPRPHIGDGTVSETTTRPVAIAPYVIPLHRTIFISPFFVVGYSI